MSMLYMRRPVCLSVLLVGLLGLCFSLGSVVAAQESEGDTAAEVAAPSDDTSADDEGAAGVDDEADAADEESSTEESGDLGVGYALDNAFLFIAAVMVFFMQAGFAMVEAGFNAQKNAVNVLFKNAMDICVGILLFFVIGFALMYPTSYEGVTVPDEDSLSVATVFSWGGVGLDKYKPDPGRTFAPTVDWLFQAVFAATAATIVSGAVAGRMRVAGYLVYSAILTAFIYPISGYWKWGGGWLTRFGEFNDGWSMGFQDFAGSAVVHGVGGFAALAGAIVLGPRIGRFVNGKSMPMPGHSLPIAALGVFILWFGWYGFNPGSQLAFQGTGDIDATMHIAVTTSLSAAAGGLVATLLSWAIFSKPDLSMGLNGILGGLVGITACCDCMTHWMAILVGAVSGILIIVGVVLLDKLQIDDPVGAFPVHGLCGVWGCMAIGILPNSHTSQAVKELLSGEKQPDFEAATSFFVQLIGTVSICAWAFITMFILFSILKVAGVLRVSAEEEQTGLDISEHGMHAYPADSLPKAN
ncbi:MAG: ammonium transporter [Planctomycetota bacterium]